MTADSIVALDKAMGTFMLMLLSPSRTPHSAAFIYQALVHSPSCRLEILEVALLNTTNLVAR
jgi:hypothetical protein